MSVFIKKVSCVLILSFVFSGLASAETIKFDFQKLDEWSYEGSWKDQSVTLTVNQSGWLIPQGEVSKSLLSYFQLIYWAKEDKAQFIPQQAYRRLSQAYPGALKQSYFIDATKELCLSTQNQDCLKRLFDFPFNLSRTQDAEVHLYIGMLQSDWKETKSYFEIAIDKDPSNRKVQFITQVFSVQIAHAILKGYSEEHRTAYTYRHLGLNTLEDGELSFWDAFREAAGNTANVLAIVFTDYEEELDRDWRRQRTTLNDLTYAVGSVLDSMIKESKLVQELPFKSSQFSFRSTAYSQRLKSNPLFSSLPKMDELGFSPSIDYVSPEWRAALITQMNALNFWMLARGPAAVRAFGATKAGMTMVQVLRLQRVVAAISRLPRPYDSIAMWLALETADGCLVRWVYSGYVVISQVDPEHELDFEGHIDQSELERALEKK